MLKAQTEKMTLLTEVEAKELLLKAGIPVIETRLARTKREAYQQPKSSDCRWR